MNRKKLSGIILGMVVISGFPATGYAGECHTTQVTDSSYTEKAFLGIKGRERDLPPGAIKVGRIRLFMVPWAAIGEEGFEVEADGVRYRVTGGTETEAYLEVEGERKA